MALHRSPRRLVGPALLMTIGMSLLGQASTIHALPALVAPPTQARTLMHAPITPRTRTQPVPADGTGGTTYYVAGYGDDGNGCLAPSAPCATIGAALAKAASGDTVSIAAGTYHEQLVLTQNVTLQGAGTGQTVIDGSAVTGTVVTVMTPTVAAIDGVTIQGGRIDGWSWSSGGIDNMGAVTLTNSTVSDNSTPHHPGGIWNEGLFSLQNSTVAGNGGGGIYNGQTGTLLVTSSAIMNNAGGGIDTSGTVTVTASTVSGNTNGGINSLGGTVAVRNSTISDNSADYGGGIQAGYTVFTVDNSTISGNSAAMSGGGVYIEYAVGPTRTVSLANSILAGNTVSISGTGPDCSGVLTSALTSRGYNIVGSDSGCTGFVVGVNGDHVGNASSPLDPVLGPLQDNGGTTLTMALLPGSPAIDAGNPAGCLDSHGNVLSTDQRGQPRPDTGSGRCDIGAYELEPSAATSTPTSTATPIPTSTSTSTATPTNTPTNTATPTNTPTSANIHANVTHASPYQKIIVTGTGFGPVEPVGLYWDSVHTRPLAVSIAGATGSFGMTMTVPQAIAGTHTIIAAGWRSYRYAMTSIQIQPARSS